MHYYYSLISIYKELTHFLLFDVFEGKNAREMGEGELSFLNTLGRLFLLKGVII